MFSEGMLEVLNGREAPGLRGKRGGAIDQEPARKTSLINANSGDILILKVRRGSARAGIEFS